MFYVVVMGGGGGVVESGEKSESATALKGHRV